MKQGVYARLVTAILLSFICSTNGFIQKKAGGIANTTKLTNSTYGCQLTKQGKTGSGSQVKLQRSHCWDSTWRAIKCSGYINPEYYILKKGVKTPVTDADAWFKTRAIAEYFGDETCVSYVYQKTDTSSRVRMVECRSECFKTKLDPPRAYIFSQSLVGSYHAQYWAFEIVSSSAPSIKASTFSVLLIILATLNSMF